ncbi:MAG: hypothetical protein RSF40_01655 [Oscillospiraceae bacterium]
MILTNKGLYKDEMELYLYASDEEREKYYFQNVLIKHWLKKNE